MKVLHDSGIDEGNNSSDVRLEKIYEIRGQLFRASVSSYKRGEYEIYRFSEAGSFELVEGQGGSFTGVISINYRDVHLLSGKIIKANWDELWEMIERQIHKYSKITKSLRFHKDEGW